MTSRIEMPSIPARRRPSTPWAQRLLIVLTLIVAADSLFGERGFASRGRMQRDFEQTRQDLAAIRNENAGLREHIWRLESDPGAIEAVARGELGLIRRGEVLFVVASER